MAHCLSQPFQVEVFYLEIYQLKEITETDLGDIEIVNGETPLVKLCVFGLLGCISSGVFFLHENITETKKMVEFSQRLIASSLADNNSSFFTTVTGTVKATF